jgi:hypothetical protein
LKLQLVSRRVMKCLLNPLLSVQEVGAARVVELEAAAAAAAAIAANAHARLRAGEQLAGTLMRGVGGEAQ